MATVYTHVSAASDVTGEILSAAEEIYSGWYADADRIDWEDLLYRLDGMELSDGTTLDLDGNYLAPAVVAIKAHIRTYRKES